jgi:hypothetical protein
MKCHKCGKETELENIAYFEISGFDIEERQLTLCKSCLQKYYNWMKTT